MEATIHYMSLVFDGCEEIAKKPLGALYSTDDDRVHRAEAGFLFTLNYESATCPRCTSRRPLMIRNEFKVHILNEVGIEKAEEIAKAYSDLLNKIEALVPPSSANGRELSLVKTKLEESAFFAKRAMALHPAHQK